MQSSGGPARRRRADAERSRGLVLDAAVRLLRERPDAGMGAIAQAAGVTRQTVYAHFSSRERLLAAAVDRLTADAVAALDAASLDGGSATEALLRFLDVSWRSFEEHVPLLLQAASSASGGSASAGAGADGHEPVAARLARLVERGRDAGEFAPGPSPHWMVSAMVALGHAAGDEAAAGRMTHSDAEAALRVSVLRLLGVRTGAEGGAP